MSEFLGAALAIARRLCRDAIRDGDRCNWLSWTIDDSQPANPRAVYRSLGPDLFDGLAGVVLFLARCRRFCGERLLNNTLDGAVRALLEQVSDDADLRLQIESDGWLRGRTGVSLCLFEAGRELQRPELCEAAARIAEQLLNVRDVMTEVARSNSLTEDGTDLAGWLDPLNGIGPAAGLAARLAVLTENSGLLERSVDVTRLLLSSAAKTDGGLFWQLPASRRVWPVMAELTQQASLTASLLEVAEHSGEASLATAAEAAVRSLIASIPSGVALSGTVGASVANQLSWRCGIAGVGLPLAGFTDSWPASETARRIRELITGLVAELAQQTRTTMREMGAEPVRDFSLFGGLAGIIEFLLSAAQNAGCSDARLEARQVGQAGIEQIVRADRVWPCGTQENAESLTMMPGLAGIGHSYLRLYDDSIPGVLETGRA